MLRLPSILLALISWPVFAQQTSWIGTWGASPSPQLNSSAQMLSSHLLFEDQTIREVVHTSAAGSPVRVRLSNAYGQQAVMIGAVHIALRDRGSSIIGSSDHPVTFGGQSSLTIPSDAALLSDPVDFQVPPESDVVVSLYLPKAVSAGGIHYSAQQTAFIGAGDQTGATAFRASSTVTSWVFLTDLEVAAGSGAGTIVAFGDSITDGALSTVDANRRWPNVLAARLAQTQLGVLDEGIGGNRILHDPATDIRFGMNALARFDRDVLAHPGVRFLILLEGINDIGHAGQSAPPSEIVSAQEIIAGLKQLIDRAHEHGIRVFGATLTPFAGTVYPGYYTPEKETKRKAVNDWIRDSHAFDGVIDFDRAVQDPAHPDHMRPAYDSGDHLHPGDAGYQAMGEAIDVSLFR